MERVSAAFAHTTLSFETGRMAKQADGAIIAQFGETVVLVAVVGQRTHARQGFLPPHRGVPGKNIRCRPDPRRVVQA